MKKIFTHNKERFGNSRIINNVLIHFDENGVAEVDDNIFEGLLDHDSIFEFCENPNENDKNTASDNGNDQSNEISIDTLMAKTKAELVQICESLSISYDNVKDKKETLANKILEVYSKAE